jgi:hypothetical protein
VNTRSLFGRPRRLGTGPGRKCIPFGPSHPALLVTDPDENKRSIIPACLRANEHCRNSADVPDDCSVCHSSSRLLFGARPANASLSIAAGYPRIRTTAAITRPKNSGTKIGGTSHSRKLNLWVSDM